MTPHRLWPILVMAFLLYEVIWWSVWLVDRPAVWLFAP